MKPIAPRPVNLRLAAVREPEASMTPPWLPTEKRRSVDWALEPVYCRVPPSTTRWAAEAVAEPLPMDETTLVSANCATFSKPPLWTAVRPV